MTQYLKTHKSNRPWENTVFLTVGRTAEKPSLAGRINGRKLQVVKVWPGEKFADLAKLADDVVRWVRSKQVGPVSLVVEEAGLGIAFAEILGVKVSRSKLVDVVVSTHRDFKRPHRLQGMFFAMRIIVGEGGQ